MALERVHPQRRQLLGQLLAHRHRERRRHADVLQAAAVVVEAEQQRADLVVAALVPAEAGDDAVRGARVLDLDHGALARLVGGVDRLGHHAVEAGALEALEPLGRQRPVVRHRREVDRRRRRRRAAAPAARGVRAAAARGCRGRRPRADRRRRTPTASPRPASRPATRPGAGAAAARSKSSPSGPAMTISPSTTQPGGSVVRSSVVQLGEVAIERPQVAALDEDVRVAAEHDGAEAVPLRLEQERARLGQGLGQLRQHRLDRRRDGGAGDAGDAGIAGVGHRCRGRG